MSQQMPVTPELQSYVDDVVFMVCKRHGAGVWALLERRSRPKGRKKTYNQPLFKTARYAAARLDAARILRGTVTNDGWIRRDGLPDEWSPGDRVKPISYPSIGRLLGGLNHSGILRGVGEKGVLTFDAYAGLDDTIMVLDAPGADVDGR